MKFRPQKVHFIFLLLILILLVLIIPLQKSIDKDLAELHPERKLVTAPAGEFLGAILFGFKDIVVDLMWLRIDYYWDHQQQEKMFPLFRTITWLDPNFLDAWILWAWHIGYNLSAAVKDPEIKEKCYWADVNILKEGIKFNQDKYDLFFECGWVYYHKLKLYAEAAKYFTLAGQCKERPMYITHILAHSYAKQHKWQKSLEIWKSVKGKGYENWTQSEVARRHIKKMEKHIETEQRGETVKDEMYP